MATGLQSCALGAAGVGGIKLSANAGARSWENVLNEVAQGRQKSYVYPGKQ